MNNNQFEVHLVTEPPNMQKDFTFDKILKALRSRYKIICIVTAIFIVIGCIFAFAYDFTIRNKTLNYESYSAIIDLKFSPTISERLSSELKFNKELITSDEFMKDAIAELKLDEAINMQKYLSVTEIIPDEVAKKIELYENLSQRDASYLLKLEEEKYIPTSYFVSLDLNNELTVSYNEATAFFKKLEEAAGSKLFSQLSENIDNSIADLSYSFNAEDYPLAIQTIINKFEELEATFSNLPLNNKQVNTLNNLRLELNLIQKEIVFNKAARDFPELTQEIEYRLGAERREYAACLDQISALSSLINGKNSTNTLSDDIIEPITIKSANLYRNVLYYEYLSEVYSQPAVENHQIDLLFQNFINNTNVFTKDLRDNAKMLEINSVTYIPISYASADILKIIFIIAGMGLLGLLFSFTFVIGEASIDRK